MNNAASSLFAGAVVDFMLHLMNRPDPMICGANYPRDKIVAEFEIWAKRRKLNTTYLNIADWTSLCDEGRLQ